MASMCYGVTTTPIGHSSTEICNFPKLKPQLASSKLLKHQSYPGKWETPKKLSLAVSAEYNGRRGGSGDFLAGFVLGGAVFGALGYLLAPVVSKSLSELENRFDEGISQKQTKYLEDDEGLERTRKNLNEKIAQLNAAIDNVSAQLRAEEAVGAAGESPPEFETAV